MDSSTRHSSCAVLVKAALETVSLRANSIGAYFAMLALDTPRRALLVSPIVDMERLILTMMGWAGVSEEQLKEQGEIATSFGQTLSWTYLCWVREHPVHHWDCPICILRRPVAAGAVASGH